MHDKKGMTLIEVLIALSILSIAITAVIHATSQNIQQTTYLQQKTLAAYTAQNLIRRTQAGLQSAPGKSNTLQGESTMGDSLWSWDITETNTAHPAVMALNVTVFHMPDKNQRIHLKGYLYAPPDL